MNNDFVIQYKDQGDQFTQQAKKYSKELKSTER